MNAVWSDEGRKAEDPTARIDSVADKVVGLDDNERLRRSNPFEVSRTTCSKEAADYAYLHHASPMQPEWRIASAAYDDGVLRGFEKYQTELDCLDNVAKMKDDFIDRLESDLKGKEARIAELEAAVREAMGVVEDIRDGRESDVPTSPTEEWTTPTTTPVEDIAGWETLATGPVEPDTTSRQEREDAIYKETYRDAYRRGWLDAHMMTPAPNFTPATPMWMPQVWA